MRLNQFDLNLLVIFETVYAEGNLTRAAEQLNVAQPTISNAMARLRTVFDDPLFIRSGRGVAPTPLATRMIGPVRQSLRQMQATLDGNITFDPLNSDRTFNISIGEIAATALLPPLIKLINKEAPAAKVRAFQSDRREIKEKLALGTLDVAVDIPRLSVHTLNRSSLTEGDYVCILRNGHPRSKGRLTLQKFLDFEFIAVSSRPTGSSLLEFAASRAGGRVEPALRTQYYLPALRIVEASDYALVAPRSLAAQFDVLAKDLPFDIDAEGSWLYWHRSVEEDQANQWLRRLIKEAWAEIEV